MTASPPDPSDDELVELTVSGMPWAWRLADGDLHLFGLASVAFWTRPSLQRLIGPLREEVGDDLYRLLVAHYSSLGTEEDYHAMITELGASFEEGFLAWGRAVSTAGWGRFSMPVFAPERSEAIVRIDNPWELQMQGPEETWGCPFLQGKLIGIFNHAFGVNCWADEQAIRRDEQGSSIEFRIAPSQRTIAVELDELRRRRQSEREAELAREIERTTRQLRESEERQRAVLSSLSDLVFTVDDSLTITHYLPPRDHVEDFPPRAEAEGRGVAAVFGQELALALRAALDRGDEIEPGSHDFAALVAGQARAYDARFAPRHRLDQRAAIEGLTVVVRDTTARRQIEAQLRQSQKMESIGLLAGGVAHDFNNLLTAIVSAADLLAFLSEDAQQRQLVETILDASETAGGLIRKLLDFSRRGQARETLVDAHAVIASTAKLLERAVGQSIRVSTSLDAARHHVIGDPNQLQSALLNLGVNARDAMPAGGEVRFTTRDLSLDAATCEASGANLRPGPYLEIAVHDTGEGMDQATIARIFEPFFTTKEIGKGTGLGLPAVYGAVAEHGGDVQVQSAPGRGTSFHLRLPVVDPEQSDAPKRSLRTPSKASAEAPATVLLADDEELVRAMAEQLLRELGYEVLVAVDGESAVATFRRERARIDVVMLDLVMPIMSGYEAFTRIRELDPDVPIVFASGFPRQGAVVEDVQGVVNKPYRLEQLDEALRGALARRS